MYESADYPELDGVWEASQNVYVLGAQVKQMLFHKSPMKVRGRVKHFHTFQLGCQKCPPTKDGLGAIRCHDRFRDLRP
jgi:hypothetical protein